jgi:hypothetical protein
MNVTVSTTASGGSARLLSTTAATTTAGLDAAARARVRSGESPSGPAPSARSSPASADGLGVDEPGRELAFAPDDALAELVANHRRERAHGPLVAKAREDRAIGAWGLAGLVRFLEVVAGLPAGGRDDAADLLHCGELERDAEHVHGLVQPAHHGDPEDDPLHVLAAVVTVELGAVLCGEHRSFGSERARHTSHGAQRRREPVVLCDRCGDVFDGCATPSRGR